MDINYKNANRGSSQLTDSGRCQKREPLTKGCQLTHTGRCQTEINSLGNTHSNNSGRCQKREPLIKGCQLTHTGRCQNTDQLFGKYSLE